MIASSDALRPADFEQHARLGITADLLARVARRVTDQEARDLLGVTHHGDLAGVAYAALHPETGAVQNYRVRRDHPEIEHGKPKNKYISSIDRPTLFFPPDCRDLLADVSVPIVFVESEKAVMALWAAANRGGRRLLPIGTRGCWNFRGRIGKTSDANGARVDETGILPDFDRLDFTQRAVTILRDANGHSNGAVTAASRVLTEELLRRGAQVRLQDVPAERAINGPDDYVGTHGDAALWTLVDGARPMQPASAADVLRLAGLDDLRGIDLTEVEDRLRRLKDGLQGADAIRRRTVRELVVTAMKKAKISGAAALADAAIGGLEADQQTAAATTLMLSDDEPADLPVDSTRLFADTAARIQRHIVMSEPQIVAMTLWIAAVYVIDALQRMAMLLISSPTSECGKSSAAALVAAFVPRPQMVASLTPAVLFRLIDKYHPTLIADEVDTWLTDEKSELRGIFNAAHWRSGAIIPRCVGDDHEIQLFNVFGAKLIAMIGRPAQTLLSRSITITLQRKTARDRVSPVRDECIRQELEPLRQQWRRWALDHVDRLRGHEPMMPADLPVNRASDNWRPLLSIAEMTGGEWPARARAAALTLSGVRVKEDEPINIQLLADIQLVFRERQQPAWEADPKLAYLSSEEIIESLKALPDRPWTDWNKGRGISPAQLAARVREFDPASPSGLRTRKTRLNPVKTAQRWHRADFEDAWSRYVTPEPEHPEQPNESGPEPEISNPEQSAVVPGSKNALPPMFPASVPGVPGLEATKPGREREKVGL